MSLLGWLIIVYVVSLFMSYLVLRKNYIRAGVIPFPFILMALIPLLNTILFTVVLWVEIEEAISYDKFLQFIFFTKKK